MISPELLKILACPLCKEEVILEKEKFLVCQKCKRKYPIRDGIPVMLVDEAIIDQSSQKGGNKK